MVNKRAPIIGAPRMILSRLALFWEWLWPALWPACAILGLFVVLAALDILPNLPGWLHLAILIGFGAYFIWSLWSRLRGFTIPDVHAARRRLERINNLDHRPLETLEDTLAQPARPAHPSAQSEQSARLWAHHQQRMAQRIAGLKVGWPTPGLIRQDPYSLRIILLVALVVAVIPARQDLGARLASATQPDLTLGAPVRPVALDAWISPPQYTDRPPIYLTGAKAKAAAKNHAAGRKLLAPAGSMLFVQVSGGSDAPVLITNGESVTFDVVPSSNVNDGYRLRRRLDENSTVEVHIDGHKINGWSINVTPDRAPTVAFAQAPRVSRHTAIHLIYSASDDYGLTRIDAKITRRFETSATKPKTPPGKIPPAKTSPALVNDSFDLRLLLPITGKEDNVAESFHDLTPHPWAGLPVDIQLTATDGVGQQSKSETIQFKLPERAFLHAVARDIIAARKQLTADPDRNKATVFNKLDDIAWRQEAYDDDIVVFMALTAAGRRIMHDTSENMLATVQQLLWDTALRIEDGKVSIAENTLRQAQKALMEALARNASDSEIEQLMNKLQSALSDYLSALEKRMRNLARQGQAMMSAKSGQTVLHRQDLQKMIDQIRSLARSGARNKARQMLSKLQRTLENMRAGGARPGGNRGQAAKAMDDMQRLTKAQGDLLNRVFNLANQIPGPGQERMTDSTGSQTGAQPGGKAGPGSQPGSQPGSRPGSQPNPQKATRGNSLSASAAIQDALRRKLGDIMQRIAEMTGEVPRPFGKAEQDMRKSTTALRGNLPRRAVDAQSRVLESLQQAMQATMQQLQQQANQNPGQGQGRAPGARAQERDPFGRSMGDEAQGANTGYVAIPDKNKLQNSRQIRDELRRRSNEHTRPRSERDYIKRLLKEF
jgi:uncharacterized protein (TIGR02302 family)